MQVTTRTIVVVCCLMAFGTLASLLSKIIYEVDGPDLKGNPKPFKKPWAATLYMFVGMAFTLPITLVLEAWRGKRKEASVFDPATAPLQQPLLDSAPPASAVSQDPSVHSMRSVQSSVTVKSSMSPKEILMISLPTICDLVATALMSVGLLYVTASVYQMMRAAEMLFSALLSVLFLKRTLNPKQLSGLLLCTIGVSLVGYASTRNPEAEPDQNELFMTHSQTKWGWLQEPITNGKTALLGMTLIILAQAVQAGQVVLEDHFMRSVGLSPLKIVGVEGVLGSALILAVILPLAQIASGPEGAGIHEDSMETWHMLTNSTPLMVTSLITIVNLALYNIAGMFVTDELGAVSRTVLETLRTLFVWLTDLVIFYSPFSRGGRIGEAWNNSSWIQAAGFAVLVAGTLVYSWGDAESVHVAKTAAIQHGLPSELANKLASWRLRRHVGAKANATLRLSTPSAVLAHRIHTLVAEHRQRSVADNAPSFASVVRHTMRTHKESGKAHDARNTHDQTAREV